MAHSVTITVEEKVTKREITESELIDKILVRVVELQRQGRYFSCYPNGGFKIGAPLTELIPECAEVIEFYDVEVYQAELIRTINKMIINGQLELWVSLRPVSLHQEPTSMKGFPVVVISTRLKYS